jgi:hypothetical protein
MVLQHYSLLATLALVACAGTRPEAGDAPGSAAAAPPESRCVAIADSVGAIADLAKLMLAAPPRTFRAPRLGSDVARGSSVVVETLVRPDGTADLSRLQIRGSRDAEYASRVRSALAATRFRPVTIAGCPVPGRFTLVSSR